jgi:hypothetical protein
MVHNQVQQKVDYQCLINNYTVLSLQHVTKYVHTRLYMNIYFLYNRPVSQSSIILSICKLGKIYVLEDE